MTFRNDDISLRQMRDHAELIVELSGDREKDEILNDKFAILAASRLFEMLGGAANRVNPETRSEYPQVPWRDIVDMRDQLLHDFDTFDPILVWHTAQTETPALLEELNRIIDQRDAG
ncbi:MAG: DUF86 domain-containing protein [Sphaerobacteraceae bacterium]|nr:MAG: DUF86 domain-containing protein [Sphaerobacteraceae bacterium]